MPYPSFLGWKFLMRRLVLLAGFFLPTLAPAADPAVRTAIKFASEDADAGVPEAFRLAPHTFPVEVSLKYDLVQSGVADHIGDAIGLAVDGPADVLVDGVDAARGLVDEALAQAVHQDAVGEDEDDRLGPPGAGVDRLGVVWYENPGPTVLRGP